MFMTLICRTSLSAYIGNDRYSTFTSLQDSETSCLHNQNYLMHGMQLRRQLELLFRLGLLHYDLTTLTLICTVSFQRNCFSGSFQCYMYISRVSCQKGCISHMAGRALLAGYHRYILSGQRTSQS